MSIIIDEPEYLEEFFSDGEEKRIYRGSVAPKRLVLDNMAFFEFAFFIAVLMAFIIWLVKRCIKNGKLA